MKSPQSLRIQLSMHYSTIVLMLGVMAASLLSNGMKDALGYFKYVLFAFALLFTILEIQMIASHNEMKAIISKFSSVHSSKTEKVSESGHKAKLGQAYAMNFKNRFLCFTILKCILSIFFMCQFFYSYELVEMMYNNEGKIFDADAMLSSSHVIFMTMITSAVILTCQRVLELLSFVYLKEWTNDKKNFRLAGKSSSKAKSGKSTKSISCSSSEGSTEASREDLYWSQDKVIVS